MKHIRKSDARPCGDHGNGIKEEGKHFNNKSCNCFYATLKLF